MQLAKSKRLLILILLATSSFSCKAPKLDFDGKIYVGSSEDQGLVAKDKGKILFVPCEDKKFDEMVCTDKFAELQKSYEDLVKKCKKW